MKKDLIKDCWNCGWGKYDPKDLRKDVQCTCPELYRRLSRCCSYGYIFWATRGTVKKILEQQRLENKSW